MVKEGLRLRNVRWIWQTEENPSCRALEGELQIRKRGHWDLYHLPVPSLSLTSSSAARCWLAVRSAVDLAVSHTSRAHLCLGPFAFAAPCVFMFFSQTALFPAGLCSQATLIRDTAPDRTMWHTQIHTAALCYCAVFRHSTYRPVLSPRMFTARLWPGVATCECGPVASDFSSLKRSWKFWFLSTVSCKWVSHYCAGQIIRLFEEQWVGWGKIRYRISQRISHWGA